VFCGGGKTNSLLAVNETDGIPLWSFSAHGNVGVFAIIIYISALFIFFVYFYQ
jgi:hypothetical protein